MQWVCVDAMQEPNATTSNAAEAAFGPFWGFLETWLHMLHAGRANSAHLKKYVMKSSCMQQHNKIA